ncbi:MAG: hypothetical protein NW201_14950 [Gemmatimonadales bacterium]|nr:hypothetical protein [Gemmatimonadales bacterium]
MSLRVLALVALALGPATLAAQVGPEPAKSPYRDIRPGFTVSFTGSRLGGDGGSLRLGPQGGTSYGARFDLRANKFLGLALGVSQMTGMERFVQDPFVPRAQRVRGPYAQTVSLVEAGFQFNVTGGKTWRRLAPFVSLTAGLALGSSLPTDTAQARLQGIPVDTTGYAFGNKFTVIPAIGVRAFLTPSVHLRLEAALINWRLGYPTSFLQDPPGEPGLPAGANAIITDRTFNGEWTTVPRLSIGLGIPFGL